MNFLRWGALIGFCWICLAGSVQAAAGEAVEQPHVTARLVSEVEAVVPGEPFWLGVELTMEEAWHVYWQNPGESGMPTFVEFQVPEGFAVGELQWPTPERYIFGGLMSYVHDGTAILMAEVTPPEDLTPGQSVSLSADVQWLVCKDICLPGEAMVSLEMPVAREASMDAALSEAFAEARAQWPIPAAEVPKVAVQALRQGERMALLIDAPEGLTPNADELYFFNAGDTVDPSAAQPVAQTSDGRLVLRLERSEYASGEAATLPGVLSLAGGWQDGRTGLAIDPEIVTAPIPAGTALAAASTEPPEPINLPLTLGLAFLGGLILNLMPCVFPVLGLKIMGFVNQAGEDRGTVIGHGLIFTLGVLLSFWALAGVLIALREGGESLGWGFQLQNPAFVLGLTVLLLVFGLNLSGLFEIGNSAVGVGSKLTAKSGFSGSFFSGVLATVVATPCSAPFLAPALGAALALPPAMSMLTFTFIAIGLAAPYLVLSAFPAAVKALPRPGAWMETFKQFMAFLLYATVAYLVWILAALVSEGRFLNILFGLVAVALACWVYGRYVSHSTKRGRVMFGRAATVGLLALGLGLGFAPVRELEWQEWSPERVAELREADRTIYIDFTARWCATCQVNKRVVFGSEVVRETLLRENIVLLKADWTDRNPGIAQALQSYGREAVPVNVIYKAGSDEPILLPELLTPGIVLDALKEG